MNITYLLRTDQLTNMENETYITYGIDAFTEEPNGTRHPFHSVNDIFLDHKKCAKLISICNTLKLDPIHLFYVIEDAIS